MAKEKVAPCEALDKSAKIQKLALHYYKLRQTCVNNGISDSVFEDVCLGSIINENFGGEKETLSDAGDAADWHVIRTVSLCVLLMVLSFSLIVTHSSCISKLYEDVIYSPCAIENNAILQEIARPIPECKFCENLTEVVTVRDITREQFRDVFAYTGVPVVVQGATKNWTAMDVFSLEYFVKLYSTFPGALQSVEEECQFLPFNIEAYTLEDSFRLVNSSPFREKDWYFGWSNCHPEIAHELRKLYSRPYFLPDNSESSNIDWIVMGRGKQGRGASIHIDFVQRPSWQAQILGTKRWLLIPPPECEKSCRSLDVVVNTGDIICIDTNLWYHNTAIEPGEMSITIGSEYD